MRFKLKHQAKKLSFVDSIGYAVAKKYGARFLTGDNQFKGMGNVEFVK